MIIETEKWLKYDVELSHAHLHVYCMYKAYIYIYMVQYQANAEQGPVSPVAIAICCYQILFDVFFLKKQ